MTLANGMGKEPIDYLAEPSILKISRLVKCAVHAGVASSTSELATTERVRITRLPHRNRMKTTCKLIKVRNYKFY